MNKDKDQLTTIIDKWSFFFKHALNTSEQDLPKVIGQDTIIQSAYEELNKFGWSEEELLSYEAVIKREMDHQAILAKQYNEVKAEGTMEARILIAKKMLKQNMAIEAIAEINGLTLQETKQLNKHK